MSTDIHLADAEIDQSADIFPEEFQDSSFTVPVSVQEELLSVPVDAGVEEPVRELSVPPLVEPVEYTPPRADRDRTQPKRDTESRAQVSRDLGDLVASGHGYLVVSYSTATILPITCRYCNGPLPLPGRDFVCEFAEQPWGDCRCNWCVIREYKLIRNKGGQPRICDSTECRKAQRRDQQRRYRARKKAKINLVAA